MLVSSMNASDISKVRVMDDARLTAFQQMKARELLRELHKQKVSSICTCFDFRTPNAEYKMTFFIKSGDVYYSGIFGYVRESNVYIPMSIVGDDGYYMALSPHFLNRYAERYLRKKLSLGKSLANFFHDFVGAAVLYADKTKRVVYAIYGGIMLGKYDSEKMVIHMKTFVSLDMLKGSQVRSYGKIKRFIECSRERIEGIKKSNDCVKINAAFDNVFEGMAKLDMDEAREIYSTFFEKGGSDD